MVILKFLTCIVIILNSIDIIGDLHFNLIGAPPSDKTYKTFFMILLALLAVMGVLRW